MSQTSCITSLRGQEVRLSWDYASLGRKPRGVDIGNKLTAEVRLDQPNLLLMLTIL